VVALAFAVVTGGCRDEVPTYALDGGFSVDSPAANVLAGRIAVTNNGDDSLSTIDPAAVGPAVRVPMGLVPVEPEGPHHLSAAPDGSFVYVNISYMVVGGGSGPHGAHGNGTMPGFVLKASTSDAKVVAKAAVEANPGDSALSADGSRLYVTHYDLPAWVAGAVMGDLRRGDSKLVAIDTASMEVLWRLPICPAAHGLDISPDGRTLYAACGPDEIAVVDLSGAEPTARRVVLPGLAEGAGCTRCPYALAVAPDASVWVASLGPSSGVRGEGGIDVYDPARPAASAGAPSGAFDPARRINLQGRAMFPAFVATPAGYRVYVPEQGPAGDWLRVFDVDAGGGAPVPGGALALDRAVCQNAHVASIAPATSQVRVVCEGDHVGPGSLVIVDLESLSVQRSIPLGIFPDDIATVPAGGS
jgi:DNA-binding beta-propeller fold protein YncE